MNITKLTQEQADEARRMHRSKRHNWDEIRTHFGISNPMLAKILSGEAYPPQPRRHPSESWPPERIRTLLDNLGLTQARLAARLGVGLRQAQAICAPRSGKQSKRPSGAVCKLLDQLDATTRLPVQLPAKPLLPKGEEGGQR